MKNLPLALALLLAGCSKSAPVVQADNVELIHLDAKAQRFNVTVVSSDGQRTTIALSPAAALKTQEGLAQMILKTMQGAEASSAQPQSQAPAP